MACMCIFKSAFEDQPVQMTNDLLKPVEFPAEIFGFSFTEYLTVFVSFIYAFAVAEFFMATGRMLRERNRIVFSWEFALWMVILLLTFIVMWYVNWLRLVYIHQSLGYFFLLILPPMLFFLLVAIFFPAFDGKNEINLNTHFLKNIRLIFVVLVFYLIISICYEVFMPTEAQILAIATQSIYLVISIAYILTERKWLRMLMAALYFLQMIAVFNHI